MKLTAAFLVSVFFASVAGCAFFQKHVDPIPGDIKACFGPDFKGDVSDIVNAVEATLVCEVSSGGDALPACVTEGLADIAEKIGPSGTADVKCVIADIVTSAESKKTGASPQELVMKQNGNLYLKKAR